MEKNKKTTKKKTTKKVVDEELKTEDVSVVEVNECSTSTVDVVDGSVCVAVTNENVSKDGIQDIEITETKEDEEVKKPVCDEEKTQETCVDEKPRKKLTNRECYGYDHFGIIYD